MDEKTSMMNFRTVIFIAGILSLLSCISVNLPTGAAKTRAQGITLSPPEAPFQLVSSELADQQWQSTKTGNNISYISECGIRNEPSLEVLQKDVLSAIESPEILDQKNLSFNGREAIRVRARGTLDGVPVQLEFLVFKKNNCSYTLTFGGKLSQFNLDFHAFEKFLAGFQAP